MMIRTALRIPVFLLLLAALAAGTATAHQGATGVVKERMDDMEALKDSMKVLDPIFKGRAALDPERVTNAAGRMTEIARRMASKFPPGTNQSPSETRPTVWDEWENFTRLIADFESATVTLGRTVEKADFDKAYIAVGAACLACHKPYRERK